MRYGEDPEGLTALYPARYAISMDLDGLMRVDVSFIAHASARTDKTVAGLMRRLGLWFHDGTGVNIVKAADNAPPRCFYCASLNPADALSCSQCGASF